MSRYNVQWHPLPHPYRRHDCKYSCVFAMIVSPTLVYYYFINRHSSSSSSSSSKLVITASVMFINSRRARTSLSYIRTAVRRSVTTVDRCCMVCCIKASGVKVSQYVIQYINFWSHTIRNRRRINAAQRFLTPLGVVISPNRVFGPIYRVISETIQYMAIVTMEDE